MGAPLTYKTSALEGGKYFFSNNRGMYWDFELNRDYDV